MSCRRYDDFNIDSNIERTPQGGLKVTGSLTRSGIFTYKNSDGSARKEYRPPEEVFSPASLATFSGSPVTLEHPPTGLNPINWKQYTVGHVSGDARQDGDKVIALFHIQDQQAVDAVLSRAVTGLSCGYLVDLDPTPGEVNGERYDAVQRNIRGNHIALTRSPRGGSDCSLRLDSAGDQSVDSEVSNLRAMDKTLDVLRAENEALQASLAAATKTRTDAAAALEVAQAQIQKLTGENAALQAQVTNLSDPKRLDSAVAERAALIETAKTHGVSVTGSEREIKTAIVQKLNPSFPRERLDSFTPEAFEAAYAVICAAPHPSLAAVRTDAANASAPQPDKVMAARVKNLNASLNAWQQPSQGATRRA